MTEARHMAELDLGRLLAPTDDLRVAEVMGAPAFGESDEPMGRLNDLEVHGDSDHAFGWTYLKEAQLWRAHGCAQGTAE
ncbi:MAG: hypothetical protein ACK40I_04535 [Tabrizicola sp.]